MSDQNETLNTHDLIEIRRSKLIEWRHTGHAFPIGFHRDALAADLLQQYQTKQETELEASPIYVKVAGRMMTRRMMGKASFVHLQDMSGRIQLYVRQDEVGEAVY